MFSAIGVSMPASDESSFKGMPRRAASVASSWLGPAFSADEIRTCLDDLDAQFKGIRFRIIDEQGDYVWKAVGDLKIGDWEQYRVKVSALETATGYHFFTNLPPAVQTALKSRIDPPPAN